MSKRKTRPSARARQVRLAMGDVWTPQIETAWEPFARKSGIPTRLWVEKLVITLMKKGRPLDGLVEQLRDGTMLDALTKAIEQR